MIILFETQIDIFTQLFHIVGPEDLSVFPDQRPGTDDRIRSDQRQALCHCFIQNKAPDIRLGRKDEEIGCPVIVVDLFRQDKIDEMLGGD